MFLPAWYTLIASSAKHPKSAERMEGMIWTTASSEGSFVSISIPWTTSFSCREGADAARDGELEGEEVGQTDGKEDGELVGEQKGESVGEREGEEEGGEKEGGEEEGGEEEGWEEEYDCLAKSWEHSLIASVAFS